jgi:hypothetical protein
MKIVISCLQIHGKEDGIYPLKEIAKLKTKDQRSIVPACTNTYTRIEVFNLLKT